MYLDQIAHYWDRRAHGYAKTIQEQLSGQERDFFQRLLRNQAQLGIPTDASDIWLWTGLFFNSPGSGWPSGDGYGLFARACLSMQQYS